ncbi:MAG TPA: phosphoadenosine phosphosulfate reductase family protein [Solimonas sp.]
MSLDLQAVNRDLGRDPEGLIAWALAQDPGAIITSNFRPFSAAILHLVTRQRADIPVVWMDNGYNTPATYQFADQVTAQLKLRRLIYQPLRSRAHREAVDGADVPALDTPEHDRFTEEVKLEPFRRALRELQPKIWITGVRSGDTAHRAGMDPVSLDGRGVIKVAPILHWTSKDLWQYLKQHGLPDNLDYYDPTKGDDKRECGLQTA